MIEFFNVQVYKLNSVLELDFAETVMHLFTCNFREPGL